MAPRPNAIPPVKCASHRTKTGCPDVKNCTNSDHFCKSWAKPGSTVCRLHGGNIPAVKNKAQYRNTIAELLQADPRPVAEAILDALAISDAFMRDMKVRAIEEAEESGSIPADLVDRLLQHAARTNTLGKTAHDAGIAEYYARQHQRNVEAEGQIISAVLGDVTGKLVDLMPDNRRAHMQQWLDDALATRLNAGPDGGPADVPDVPEILRASLNDPADVIVPADLERTPTAHTGSANATYVDLHVVPDDDEEGDEPADEPTHATKPTSLTVRQAVKKRTPANANPNPQNGHNPLGDRGALSPDPVSFSQPNPASSSGTAPSQSQGSAREQAELRREARQDAMRGGPRRRKGGLFPTSTGGSYHSVTPRRD